MDKDVMIFRWISPAADGDSSDGCYDTVTLLYMKTIRMFFLLPVKGRYVI